MTLVLLLTATAISAQGKSPSNAAAIRDQLEAPQALPLEDHSVSKLVPSCAVGQLPVLDIAVFPQQANTHGAPTPEAALRDAVPSVGAFATTRMGTGATAPVWFVAGSQTFIATVLPDGTWFLSPAKFVGCDGVPARPTRTLGGGTAPVG